MGIYSHLIADATTLEITFSYQEALPPTLRVRIKGKMYFLGGWHPWAERGLVEGEGAGVEERLLQAPS